MIYRFRSYQVDNPGFDIKFVLSIQGGSNQNNQGKFLQVSILKEHAMTKCIKAGPSQIPTIRFHPACRMTASVNMPAGLAKFMSHAFGHTAFIWST